MMRMGTLMKRLLLAVLPLLLLPACNDHGVGPSGGGFPTKLYPYEVTYDAAVFKQRRDALIQKIPVGSVVLVTTNGVYLRNGDVNYDFRPASTFYYLTGFEEPNAVAMLRKRGSAPGSSEMVMFVESRQGTAVQWLGSVYGPEGAVQYFGADSAYDIGSLPSLLGTYLGSGAIHAVYANLDANDGVKGIYASVAGSSVSVQKLDSLVDEMRPVKVPLELGLIRRAIDVSAQAFVEGMRATKASAYEYEVQAALEFVVRLNGCPRTAFPTIVASGPNITTIHYDANSRAMVDGDLVMVDFGAEYGYYAADLTRTIPVTGRFSAEQAAIYDIVKRSHDAVLAASAPGVSFNTLSTLNIDVLIDGLLEKGVITGTKSDIISSGQYRLYIPAGLGHQIGLDVHDPWPGDANNNRILRENMVLAIEPHLYLTRGDLTVAAAYRGICARIEDDILITRGGCEVLSAALPGGRAELEAIMMR
jgi:Xaa-Pro aminopeptidase